MKVIRKGWNARAKALCAIMACAMGFASMAEVAQTGNNVVVTGVATVSVDVAELQVDVRPGAALTIE